ncbi:hypothetical protein C9374_000132 [Naegleria lovaniensis]|uniref:Uncharacterized protein n=1 Tax=Naegleria lovaniensis TaxID=51637 RepID=A0AA88GZW3_NAELO|nr:uncharacterized protein C9374_000132 [Naegleria lovaniensis]KAG2388693.1 hypothetical protein C9374_000132 [Naegleria lovaniensis]
MLVDFITLLSTCWKRGYDILLSVFRLDDFYHYFTEKDFTKFQAQKLFSPSSEVLQIIHTTDTFLYSADIIWLAYAIVGHLYCQGLNKNEDNLHVNKLSAFPSKHLEVLKINKDMFEQLAFAPAMAESPKSETSERYNRNILLTTESVLSISNQIGFELFELFLSYTSLLLRCDDSSLVQLVLSIFGQLLANVNDFILATLIKNKRLNIVKHIEHLLCCTDENVVIILGKCIFVLFLRDVNFITDHVLNNSKILNEIIYWALNAQQSSTKVQYLNLLFLLVLQSEKLSINLITNNKINILYHISNMLRPQSSQKSNDHNISIELEPSLQFVFIQLFYGLSTHSSCHQFIIEYAPTNETSSNNNIIQILKALSFSQYPLTRYYSFLIWSNLLTLSSYHSGNASLRNDKIHDNRYTRYLCRNEQVLNLLMYAYKEETEMIIKRVITLLLKDICAIRQNNYERIILLEHFNLLFESIDLLHFQMSYLMDVYETRNGIFNEEESMTVDQSVQLSIAQTHLITTIVRMDAEDASHTGTSPTLELLKTQYQIQRYIMDLLIVLDKRGDVKNANTIRALASVLQLEV